VLRAGADGATILATGCGTSLHAAAGLAAILNLALGRHAVRQVQALELARELEQWPSASGLVLAVSHEGGTWATNLALEAARAAGVGTALVTVSGRSPGAALADHLLLTIEQDQSWCHTVGYLSPLLAAATLAGELSGSPLAPHVVRGILQDSADGAASSEMAGALSDCDRLLMVGSGLDRWAAAELALKVEEGARLPATAMELETIRHGHLAAATARTGLVLLLTDAEGWGAPVTDRSLAVLRSAQALGMPAAAIVAADLADGVPPGLTPVGRQAVPLPASLQRAAAAALASAIPIQLLAERLARARGVEPDSIGRTDPRQVAAADA
jgi:fructoselysine-6-P-deglycase FrlB-like protein